MINTTILLEMVVKRTVLFRFRFSFLYIFFVLVTLPVYNLHKITLEVGDVILVNIFLDLELFTLL